LRNGLLISAAEGRHFEVLVTADQSIVKQQNNAKRKIAIVQLSTTRWLSIRSAHERILEAVEQAVPGSFQAVEIPIPKKLARP
ncbi:MAG: hypothetical protein V4555_05460, partial [Acidobacteriota bacterium]